MVMQVEKLPYGVGHPTRRWFVLAGSLLALVGLGGFAYGLEAVGGLSATGLRDIGTMQGATWGLYIAFVVYFVGVSFGGITIAALIRLANLTTLRPIARMAELLAVVSLILAALAILADLGQPLRGIINLFRYARPQSPFFGTFTLVISGYLFASLVYLYLGLPLSRLPARRRPVRQGGWATAGGSRRSPSASLALTLEASTRPRRAQQRPSSLTTSASSMGCSRTPETPASGLPDDNGRDPRL